MIIISIDKIIDIREKEFEYLSDSSKIEVL